MRWHRRLAPVLGTFFLLASALVNAQDTPKDKKEAKPVETPNLYPIEVGNAWHYRVSANGRTANIITRIAKIETIGGEILARLESPNVAQTEHLTQTAKGVFRHRTNGVEVTPPFQLVPYPAKPGTKWDGEFVVANKKEKHKYFGEVQKEETVDVPAGKFKTVRVYIKLEENGMMVETTYWFAKDIGFVKQTFDAPGVSLVLELEKVERKK